MWYNVIFYMRAAMNAALPLDRRDSELWMELMTPARPLIQWPCINGVPGSHITALKLYDKGPPVPGVLEV